MSVDVPRDSHAAGTEPLRDVGEPPGDGSRSADPSMGQDVDLGVVIPVLDEQEVWPRLVERLRPVLDGTVVEGRPLRYEVLVVDDGSTDATPAVVERTRRDWPQLRVVRLRVNAGHQAALSAGLARVRGAHVVTLDADLQDPPELVPDLLTAARDGADVVYAVREDRGRDTRFKRGTARAYYALMRRAAGDQVPTDAGDFRLMSRATVEAVNTLPEHHRVLRLAVPALGFPSAQVPYRREERAAGRSKYPLARMLRLSVDSLTGFSIAPLRFATWCGLGGGLATLLLLLYALGSFLLGSTVPGWTSTVVAVAAVGCVQLLCLGVLGEYVGRLYVQLQGRPAYYVARDSAVDSAGRAGLASGAQQQRDPGQPTDR